MKIKILIVFLGCLLITREPSFAATVYTVGTDDTVYGIAYAHGIPTRAVISANNLKTPYVLEKGQRLTIPSPHEHIVGNNETIKSVAEEYAINVDVLARENGLQAPYYATPGTHLLIPSRDTASLADALNPPAHNDITTSSLDPLPLVKSIPAPGAPQETSGPLPLVQAAPALADPQGESSLPPGLAAEIAAEKSKKLANTTASSKPPLMGNLAATTAAGSVGAGAAAVSAVASAPPEKEKPKKEIAKAAKPPEVKKEAPKAVTFIRPVEGKIIGKFAAGGKNDGINIKVKEGTTVKAAADGEVMYAGSELKGFGNLLLIKHKDGWVTAYAHNSSLLVKKGDKVKQSQGVAKSGKTGDVKEAQLHFELRKGKEPIDPTPKFGS